MLSWNCECGRHLYKDVKYCPSCGRPDEQNPRPTVFSKTPGISLTHQDIKRLKEDPESVQEVSHEQLREIIKQYSKLPNNKLAQSVVDAYKEELTRREKVREEYRAFAAIAEAIRG